MDEADFLATRAGVSDLFAYCWGRNPRDVVDIEEDVGLVNEFRVVAVLGTQ